MSEAVTAKEVQAYTNLTGEIYDLIYEGKDYAGEATKITGIIEQNCESGGNTLLEAACGTGIYMQNLSGQFEVSGFDLSAGQIEVAKSRLPEANIFQGDMLDFDAGQQYDAVICLFSSIGYLRTKDNLDRAVANMAKHTKPGGILIVEPWLKAEDLKPGYTSLEAASNDHLAVSRMGKLVRDGNVTKMAMHHMIGTKDGVEHYLEHHEVAMYTDEEFTDAFQKAGLEISIDPEGLIGRGLCVGKKSL